MIDTTDLMNFILAVFVVLGFFISAYFFFTRKILMSSIMGGMFLSSSIGTLMYAFQISDTPLSGTFIFVAIRYVALTVFAFTLVLFVFDFTQTPITYRSPKFLWLASVPALLLLYLVLNPHAAWLYFNMSAISLEEIFAIDKFIAPVYVFLHAYVVVLLCSLFFILFKGFRQKPRLNRINTLIIATGLFIYISTHLIHLSGVRLLGSYSINMLTYSPVALLSLWGYSRYRLADIRPLAYNTIFSQMQDGILVVDRSGYLVDFNPAANHYMHASEDLLIGRQLNISELEFPDFGKDQHNDNVRTIKRELNGLPCLMIVTALSGLDGVVDGYLISIRDISSEVETELLREAEMVRKAAWEERMRLARGLHDSALQNVGSLIMLSGAISQSLVDHPSQEASQLLETMQIGANLAYEDLRSFISELQFDDEPADNPFDFRKALEAKLCYLRQREQAHLKLFMPDSVDLDVTQQRELSYIILEAVNNAIKHSRADTISIVLQQYSDKMVVDITDDGCGFDPQRLDQPGMGLQNMRSRVSLLNGELIISSQATQGTNIRIIVPLAANENRFDRLKEMA